MFVLRTLTFSQIHIKQWQKQELPHVKIKGVNEDFLTKAGILFSLRILLVLLLSITQIVTFDLPFYLYLQF